MKTGNSVPATNDRHDARVHDDSQLRDIEELVAKLQLVTKQLQFPVRPASAQPRAAGHGGETPQDEGADGEMN